MENNFAEGQKGLVGKQFSRILGEGNSGRMGLGESLSKAVSLCRENGMSFFETLNKEGDYLEKNNLFDINDFEITHQTRSWLKGLEEKDRRELVEDAERMTMKVINGELAIGDLKGQEMKLIFMVYSELGDLPLAERTRILVDQNAAEGSVLEKYGKIFKVAAGDEREIGLLISEIGDAEPEKRKDLMFFLGLSSSSRAREVVWKEVREDIKTGGDISESINMLNELADTEPTESAKIALELMNQRLKLIREIKEKYGSWNNEALNELNELNGRTTEIADYSVYKLAVLAGDPLITENLLELIKNNQVPKSEEISIIDALGSRLTVEQAMPILKHLIPNRGDYSDYSGVLVSLGKVLNKERVKFGDDGWQKFTAAIPEFEGRDGWVNSLAFETYTANDGPGETRRFLLSSLADIDLSLLARRPSLALELVQEKMLSGNREDEELALDLFTKIKSPQKENKRWRNVMVSLTKIHPGDIEVLRKVNAALVQRGHECEDPEIINYLVDEFKNLAKGKNNLDKLIVFTDSLITADARYALRTLYETIIDPKVDSRVAESLVRGLADKDIFDMRILRMGNQTEVTAAVQLLLRAGLRVDREAVQLINQGKSIDQIRAIYQETLKIPYGERIKDDNAMGLEFSCASQTEEYDSVFAYSDFKKFVDGMRLRVGVNAENGIILKKVEKQWGENSGDQQSEIEKKRKVYELGIPDRVVEVRFGDNESERRSRRIREQISFFGEQIKPVVLVDQLLGRMEGLVKKMRKNGVEDRSMTEAIKIVGGVKNINGQQVVNFEEIYVGLYGVFSGLYTRAVEQGILAGKPPNQDEILNQDIEKLTGDANKGIPGVGGLGEQTLGLLDKIQLAKKRLERLKIENGGWNEAVGDLLGAMEKLREMSRTQIEIGAENDKSQAYALRFLSSAKSLYGFCRVGDARESCIATNGGNNWTIPGYALNEGTRGFIVINQRTNRAVGHSVTHLYESQGKLGVISNGIYLDSEVPLEVADNLIDYISDWAEESGFSDTKIAASGFSDVVPVGWNKQSVELLVLKGVMGNLYYDGKLPIETAEEVEVIGKTGEVN